MIVELMGIYTCMHAFIHQSHPAYVSLVYNTAGGYVKAGRPLSLSLSLVKKKGRNTVGCFRYQCLIRFQPLQLFGYGYIMDP